MNSFYPYYGYVYIDLAQVLQAHSEGMMRAFMMGQQMNVPDMEADVLAESQAATSPFIGIFDRKAYGVYQSPQKLDASKQHWDAATCRKKPFPTYQEALSFARQGVAILNKIAVERIPSMQHPINWMQYIALNEGKAY